ncbi:MAG: hypothetical protein ACFFE8_04735 [Candidatus Heimdallarchaeota archaeon]
MLILPQKITRRFRFKFLGFFVIGLSIIGLGMLDISFLSTNGNDRETQFEAISEDVFGAAAPLVTGGILSIQVIQPLILSFGILILSISYFSWMPNLIPETFGGIQGNMTWKMGRFKVPKRYLIFNLGSCTIQVARKITTFNGIALRELLFEVHLEKDHSRWKEYADFAAFGQVEERSDEIVLQKLVKPQHIPIQLILAQTLLSEPKINHQT